MSEEGKSRFDIRPGDPADPQLLALLRMHLENMMRNSPPKSVHALTPDELHDDDDLAFWCAWKEGALLGCAALKDLGDDHGEIKSMVTDSRHLRKGVASALLQHIVGQSRTRGYHRLSLETGSGGAFKPAHSLYTRNGFRSCGPFGQYVDDGFAIYMTIDLD